MATTLTLYTFEDADGDEFGTFTTQDYQAAREHAQRNGLRVIGNEYEFADSELVDDFTSSPADDDDDDDDDDTDPLAFSAWGMATDLRHNPLLEAAFAN